MFKIDWLLIKRPFLIYLCASFVLFVISYLQLIELSTVEVLKIPFISALVFKGMHLIFLLILKRNPENTFWEFSKKPLADILFTLIFWLLGTGLPFLLVL
jgi:hypothetical protein